MRNKKGEGPTENVLIDILIGIAILIILIMSIAVLTGKLDSLIEFIKNIFGFR